MTGSKRARFSASIVNRTNTCGGVKKAGLGPRVGVSSPFAFRAVSNRASSKLVFTLSCPKSYTDYQGFQKGGIGRMYTRQR